MTKPTASPLIGSKRISGFVHSPADGDEQSSKKPEDWPKHDFNTTRLASSHATKEEKCGRKEDVDDQQDDQQDSNYGAAIGDDGCENANSSKFLNFRFL